MSGTPNSVPKKRKRKRRKKEHRILKGILTVFLVFLVLIFAAIGITAVYVRIYVNKMTPTVQTTLDSLDLEKYDSKHATHIYYQNTDTGQWELWETLHEGQDIEWVEYENIPVNLVNATVSIEDKRYWTHAGVDWQRVAGAAYNYFIKKDINTAGGSSITQQLIKNLTGNTDRTIQRKAVEILEALELEKRISKNDIIEIYLNNIYFGNNCAGIYRAARKYFNKDVQSLTLIESALLISTTNNPGLYDPYKHPENVKKRAAIIISQMYDQKYITKQQANEALQEIGYTMSIFSEDKYLGLQKAYRYDLVYHPETDHFQFQDGFIYTDEITEDSDHVYQWYLDAVLSKLINELMRTYGYTREEANHVLYCGGLEIYTCIDWNVQKQVDAVYENRYLLYNQTANGEDMPPQSAITIVDNETGAVIALAGGLGEKTSSRIWNRAVDTVRPSGSSIKPLSVYAPAIDLGVITPNSIYEDSPFNHVLSVQDTGNEPSEPWPVNADGYYRGNVDIKFALANSLNTIAVKVLDDIGLNASYGYLTERFHLTSIVNSDIDYAPLALGGLTDGVSTYEMAAAFSVFPRNGTYIEPYLYSMVTDKNGNVVLQHTTDGEQAISWETAATMTELMRDVIRVGTGQNAKLDVDCAGKTGTTTNNYDLWFCGFTHDYTAAVWTGYDTQIELSNPYPNPSAQTWHDIMAAITAGHPNNPIGN